MVVAPYVAWEYAAAGTVRGLGVRRRRRNPSCEACCSRSNPDIRHRG
ncbi:hypothetical protein ACP4OV_003133 [Aristida adscensionis]